VIRAALRLLAVGDPVLLEEIGWLLRSPYLGGARTEWNERARADVTLRQRGRSEWRLAALPRALAGVPHMAAIVEKLREAGKDRRRRLPGEWAEHFARLLESCGWPGDRGLASREFQAISHLKETVGQLASLDRVAEPMARGEALAILNRLAAESVFQIEGGEGRIQVLGMLEAAGFAFDALWVLGLHEGAFPSPPRPNPFLPLTVQSRLRMPHADAARERVEAAGFAFDALWVLGLHEGAFPSPPRPNPFLPLTVQSRLRMPHADAAREREFARRLVDRLFAAAPGIVASWPSQLDGAPLRCSPLIKKLPAARLALAPSCDPFQALLDAPCTFEQLADDRAAAIAIDRPFTGGTGILTDQALCPFRAFAHHRLHARQLDAPDLGLDNLARGSLVHGILERFWRQIGTHAALLALEAPRQAELLTVAAEEAIQQYERRNRCDLPQRLRALEHRRLTTIAGGWLELERSRASFRVAEIEQWHDAKVGSLKLRTRIDRIDELAEGALAVIDYKTGRPDPRQWFDERVTEPQLPLYCLDLDAERIAAVLFAVVRSRESECSFKGVARDPDVWPKLAAKGQDKLLEERGWSCFDEILAHWRVALPALGDAFVAGQAAVDPVDRQQACKYCDLSSLCRIGDHCSSMDDGSGEGGADE